MGGRGQEGEGEKREQVESGRERRALDQVGVGGLRGEPLLGADQDAAELGKLIEAEVGDTLWEIGADGPVPTSAFAQRAESDSEKP